jgi:MoxR-like ATPase
MTWELFTGKGVPDRAGHKAAWERIPSMPPWRQRSAGGEQPVKPIFKIPPGLTDAVNASLHLRRPLLLTGGPGSGKSTLVELIAAELELGPVLRWHITSRSTLADGLFEYDALGRLHATQTPGADPAVDAYVTLGPLGTALAADKVRAVLIDEIDKSDLDLPGDLLNVIENGEFPIPVLGRVKSDHSFTVGGADGARYTIKQDGLVRRQHFPMIVFTSNGERTFSPPFLRRCVRFTMPKPGRTELENIVKAHLGDEKGTAQKEVIAAFAERLQKSDRLAINQILEFVYLITGESAPQSESGELLARILLDELSGA